MQRTHPLLRVIRRMNSGVHPFQIPLILPANFTTALKFSSPSHYRRLIKLATYPAPNPLSMFTTVTLLAQLFNIPSNAARPLKLAP